MSLTEAEIAAEPTPSKMKKLSDGGGLQLWLMPAGTKLWRFCYRHEGQQRALRLGEYPQVKLKAARMMRDHARGELANRRDPNPAPKGRLSVRGPTGETFAELANEWREKQLADKRAPATIIRSDRLLAHALPYLAGRSVSDIKPMDIMEVLKKVASRGHHESAARLRMAMSQIMRFAVATGRAQVDPASALVGALARPKAIPRAAIVDQERFGKLLNMIEEYNGQPATVAALRLLPLLACRPGELRLARWNEFDLKNKLWIIPASRMKMRREHRMHLPGSAVRHLTTLRSFTGNDGLVFPAIGRNGRAMSENTVNAALRSLGVGQQEHCAHGFRSSFSTITNEAGLFRPDVIERHLAHEDRNAVRGIYNRAEHWAERVKLAEWWAFECENLATLHS